MWSQSVSMDISKKNVKFANVANVGFLSEEAHGAVARQPAPKTGKKRKKRERGQKSKVRKVVGLGEQLQDRTLKNGKVRQLDILRGNYERHGTTLSRKTREVFSKMAKLNGGIGVDKTQAARGKALGGVTDAGSRETTGIPGSAHAEQIQASKAKTRGEDTTKDIKNSELPEEATPEAVSKHSEADNPKENRKKKRFDGMQPGESFAQFSARLRKESKKMIIDTARKGNHQREKKRAFYEKRRERMERKKKRRRGELSDSDVEDENGDDEAYRATAHLPGYWQEILQNNGRPISAKRRRKMRRADADDADLVDFREQVERPPEFSALPVRRGKR